VQKHIDTNRLQAITQFIEITPATITIIKEKQTDLNTKVINLIKSIEKIATEESDDPYWIGMAERAKAVQEKYEDRQLATAEAVEKLLKEIEANERRKKEQAEKGFDGLTYFVYSTLTEAGIPKAEEISRKIKAAFVEHSNWAASEKELREVRQKMTFALYTEIDKPDKIKTIVDHLLNLMMKARRV